MLLRLRTRIPEGDLTNDGRGRKGQSRSQTPTGGRGKGVQQRNRSQSNRSRGKESTLPCYAYSWDPKNCRGSLDGCNGQHRGLTDAEKLKRDKYEQAKLDSGQSLGYERTAKQANAAAANVSSTAGDSGSRASSNSSEKRKKDGDKNKGRGKGKDMI
eukprot:2159869-Pyramimonas_sp.AAC.1